MAIWIFTDQDKAVLFLHAFFFSTAESTHTVLVLHWITPWQVFQQPHNGSLRARAPQLTHCITVTSGLAGF